MGNASWTWARFTFHFRLGDLHDVTRQGGGNRVEGLVDALKRGWVIDDRPIEVFEAEVDLLLRHGHHAEWWTNSVHIDLDDPADIGRYQVLLAQNERVRR
jgi:hypothetical protein